MKRSRCISAMIAAVLAAALATVPGPARAVAQTRTGSLSGTVIDTRGTAVRDATIVVYPADLSAPEAARTGTGVAGTFAVPALGAGSYRVLIDRDGWSEWAPGRITDPAGATAYRIVAGRNTTADSIVTAAGVIAGHVIAPRGGPAAGIVVTVDDPTLSSWNTTTADDGTYSVSLPPGTGYVVTFTNGELRQYSRRTLDWTRATHYTVRSGRTTRVNERLLAPAVISGRLVDESGTPVARAQVSVDILATAGFAETTTGTDGTYRFDALPPGDVIVGFTAPDGRHQWAYRKTSAQQADRITLTLGTVTTVDETLLAATPPGVIAGQVSTPAGEPAAGITVTVNDPTAEAWDTTTAADGTYAVTLPPGSGYVVSFTNGKLVQYSRRTLDPAQATHYTVTSGATTVVDEQLIAPAVLVGRLLEESGTPVAGAQVSVDILATAGFAETTTGTDGTYRFDALPPGDVIVGFTAPDGRHQWAYRKTSAQQADRITLTLGTITTVDETLLPLATSFAGGPPPRQSATACRWGGPRTSHRMPVRMHRPAGP